MPRKMSFFLTKKQFVDRTKTVTRRIGWKHLKPGDVVMGAEKCMGLKKGEKVVDLGLIRILGNRREPLNAITLDDVKMEGFPEMSTSQFIAFFLRESGRKKKFTAFFPLARKNSRCQTFLQGETAAQLRQPLPASISTCRR